MVTGRPAPRPAMRCTCVHNSLRFLFTIIVRLLGCRASHLTPGHWGHILPACCVQGPSCLRQVHPRVPSPAWATAASPVRRVDSGTVALSHTGLEGLTETERQAGEGGHTSMQWEGGGDRRGRSARHRCLPVHCGVWVAVGPASCWGSTSVCANPNPRSPGGHHTAQRLQGCGCVPQAWGPCQKPEFQARHTGRMRGSRPEPPASRLALTGAGDTAIAAPQIQEGRAPCGVSELPFPHQTPALYWERGRIRSRCSPKLTLGLT